MSDAINNYVRPRIRLKTGNSYFVSAENGGGGLVVANRRQADAWETFTLHDLTDSEVGSRLQYGRRIALQASGGKFVYPEGGGGGRVVAKGPAVGGWEPFLLHSADGNSGDVTPGQRVALQAVGGQFLHPEGGGGAGLVAKGAAIGGWEPLQIAIRPQAINLQ